MVQYQRAELPLVQKATVDITYPQVCISGKVLGFGAVCVMRLTNSIITLSLCLTHCMCSGTKPTLQELLRFTRTDGSVINIPVEIGTKYVKFSTFLLDDRNGSRVKIMARKHHYNAEEINTEILQEWLTEKGKQPVTWATLVEVLHDIELSALAAEIEAVKCPVGQV